MLNKQKGNMYPFVTHTWNPIRGKCPHDCIYCYMKKFKVGKLRLDEKSLKDNLGENNFIFIGSSTDMFAEKVPNQWLLSVLGYIRKYPKNTYLFQSKNPARFGDFDIEQNNLIFGTTIETTQNLFFGRYTSGNCARYIFMNNLRARKMLSIEPIVDFDTNIFVKWIKEINPEFVSIGADSKGHNLKEPSKEKVNALINELKKFTEVKIKDNLKRIY